MIRNPSNKDVSASGRKILAKPRREPKKIEAKIEETDARANDELEFEGWHSSTQVLAVYGQAPASTYEEAKVVKKKQMLIRNETEEQPLNLQAGIKEM